MINKDLDSENTIKNSLESISAKAFVSGNIKIRTHTEYLLDHL